MSQENVEVVGRIAEAFLEGVERGDFAAWNTDEVAADVEFVPAPGFMEQSSFIGVDGFAGFFSRWTEDFEGYSIEFHGLLDAGDDCVLGSFHQSGTGKKSGAPADQDFFIVYDLTDGQLVRMRSFLSRPEALEAAGLSE
jgi:ketosteroid isomerase-like protein